jgi:hypothetical protein
MTHIIRDGYDKDIASFQGDVPRAGEHIFVVTRDTGLTKVKVEEVFWAVINTQSRACIYVTVVDINLPPMSW